jgi:integrase
MARPVKFRGKWRIRWIDEFGKRQSDVFDDHKHAAAELRRHQHEVEEVRRGLRSPTPPDKTFGDLCDYWLENRAPQKRSQHHDVSIIRAHLRPAFGVLRLLDLGIQHADRFMVERKHLNSKTVANIVTLLITMLNAAVDLGWLHKVPRIRKPKVRTFDKDFSYLRTDEEIARFLRAARDEGDGVDMLYATAVFTGMRAGELAGLRWDDVDFSRRLITVQRSYSGPTKAGDVRYVPILDALLANLRDWRLRCPGQIVFPSETGTMQAPSGRIFQEVFHRVLDAAGFPKAERRGKLRRYIVFHDLRHSFASHWVMNGGDIFKLQKILGHKSVQMTMRYAHLAPNAFAADYGRLDPVAISVPTKVLDFPGPRRP